MKKSFLKFDKQFKKHFNFILGLFLIIGAFMLMGFSHQVKYSGFHNVDLAWNFGKTSQEINAKLYEYNITEFEMLSVEEVLDNATHGVMTLGTGYRTGIMQLDYAYSINSYAHMMLLVGIILLIFERFGVK